MYLTHKRVECCVFDHVRVGRFGICLSFRICSAINSWSFRHLQSTATKAETHVSQPPGIFLGCDDAVRLGRSL